MEKPIFIRFASGNTEFYDGDMAHWHSAGHAVRRCDATTGHAVRDVAYCDTQARAAGFVVAMAQRADLLAALSDIVNFCDDPNGSENPETLADGLARMLPAARAAIIIAESAA